MNNLPEFILQIRVDDSSLCDWLDSLTPAGDEIKSANYIVSNNSETGEPFLESFHAITSAGYVILLVNTPYGQIMVGRQNGKPGKV